MSTFLSKLNASLPTIALIVIGCIYAHDKFAPTSPTETHDAAIVKLGKDYRAKVDALLGTPFAAVSNGSFDTIDELTLAQQKALTAALTEAYTPIATELESRFGKAEDGKAPVAGVKNFFADLSYGYGK